MSTRHSRTGTWAAAPALMMVLISPLAADGVQIKSDSTRGMERIRIDFSPSSGSPEEWNDAYARLADYFRAHRIHSRVHRTYLILETLHRAAETHQRHPAVSPMEAAIHEARRMHRAWLRTIIGDLNVPEARLDANGRLAFLLCDGPNKYPDYFIGEGEAPQELIESMRRPIEQSGPDLAFSSMVPRPIDLGPMRERDGEESGFLDNPWLRYVVLLCLTGIVIYGLYLITR